MQNSCVNKKSPKQSSESLSDLIDTRRRIELLLAIKFLTECGNTHDEAYRNAPITSDFSTLGLEQAKACAIGLGLLQSLHRHPTVPS